MRVERAKLDFGMFYDGADMADVKCRDRRTSTNVRELWAKMAEQPRFAVTDSGTLQCQCYGRR